MGHTGTVPAYDSMSEKVTHVIENEEMWYKFCRKKLCRESDSVMKKCLILVGVLLMVAFSAAALADARRWIRSLF